MREDQTQRRHEIPLSKRTAPPCRSELVGLTLSSQSHTTRPGLEGSPNVCFAKIKKEETPPNHPITAISNIKPLIHEPLSNLFRAHLLS